MQHALYLNENQSTLSGIEELSSASSKSKFSSVRVLCTKCDTPTDAPAQMRPGPRALRKFLFIMNSKGVNIGLFEGVNLRP